MNKQTVEVTLSVIIIVIFIKYIYIMVYISRDDY